MFKFRYLKALTVCLILVTPEILYPQDSFISMLNDTIHALKYVFEARIDSVQTYPGDKNGDPIPYAKADWSGGAGNFSSLAYSKVWMSICRVYKGKLPKKILVLILQEYVSVYAFTQPSGDTALGYVYVPPSHGKKDYPLLPSRSYPITFMYWCYDASHSKNNPDYFIITEFMKSSMDIPTTFPKPDGSAKRGRLYAMLGLENFMTQAELSSYLRKIKTLDANPRCRCINPKQ
jgi:hypothetical protein